MNLRDMSPVWQLCGAQALVTVLAAVIAWIVADVRTAGASLFGGAVVVLPGLWFARRALAGTAAGEPRQMLNAVYRAEIGKLLLTALLLFIGVAWFARQFAALMLTCIACLAMNWLALAFARNT